MSSRNFSQKTNERICFSILTTRKFLILEFQFQVSSISESSGQKNKFIRSFFRDLLTFMLQDLAILIHHKLLMNIQPCPFQQLQRRAETNTDIAAVIFHHCCCGQSHNFDKCCSSKVCEGRHSAVFGANYSGFQLLVE